MPAHTHPAMPASSPSSPRTSCRTAAIVSGVALLSATSLLLAQRPPFPPPQQPGGGAPGIRSNRPGGDPNAKKENRVSITTEGDFRIIKSNGWPDHKPGQFPRRGNPNTAYPQDYTFRVALDPQPADSVQRRGGWFSAVGLNGVPFEPGTGETWNNDRASGWRYEAHTGFLDLGLDEHNAHVQPTGAYHYHAMPVGLVQKLGGDEGKMLQVAWAADGYAMFAAHCGGVDDGGTEKKNTVRSMKTSWRLKKGARPRETNGPGGNYDGRFTQDWEYAEGLGDLDETNGHTAPTPEHPKGVYHYHITTAFPFLPRGWHGTPDESFGKGGPGGPGGPGGRRPPFPGGPGGPPRGPGGGPPPGAPFPPPGE